MLLNDKMRMQIGSYLEIILAFNSTDHQLIWQYIIVVAAQLEYLAITVLLLYDREDPKKFWEYNERMTLGNAVNELERRNLLLPETREIMRSIGKLRNAVLHRQVMKGMTEYALYKGKKVFYDAEAIKQLTQDATYAVENISAWRTQHSR